MESQGRGKNVEPLEIRSADIQEELLVEVRSSQGVVASGALSASELWKVAPMANLLRTQRCNFRQYIVSQDTA